MEIFSKLIVRGLSRAGRSLPTHKLLLSTLMIFLYFHVGAQNVLIDRKSRISFYSSAPLEDITAVSGQASSALDINTREIVYMVAIKSFEFKRRLMQTHFNENYMESDKYPHSTFTGKISSEIDFGKNGKYRVTVSGSLDIHGVKKTYTTQGIIEVKDKVITSHAKFNVKLADHNIKIPRIVVKNIAEIVEVEVSSTYQMH